MKESTLATKVMIAILCLGVAVYLAVYFVQGWEEPLVTARAYTYTQDVGMEARGILVREETILPDAGGSYVDQILAEGEKAAAGQAAALLYTDPAALTTRQAIRTLSAEIEQLQYALSSGTQATDASRLDGQVLSSITALRSLTAKGDLTALEDYALSLRTMVFKRDYAYGDTNAAGQLGQLIQSKQAELVQLNASLNQVASVVYTPAAGVFSGTVDGWEGLLTPDKLEGLTAAGLEALLAQSPAPAAGPVGKLITGSTWYFAALLEGTDTGLKSGRTYTLTFSGDYYGQIPMELDRVSLEGEQTLAIFSCRSHLADTTLLRAQTVDVVIHHLEGIRVPRKALRVETVDEPLESGNPDGPTRQVNRYKVYIVERSQAWGREVEILYTDENFYLVRPVDPAAAKRLRAGDEIILNSSGIYDGKVVR
ncbi:MAG: hypothetical protein HFF22_05310 [Oscillospiraceae bacterium]|jgi:hypothetical protein|nr:hypothetical protein [Oscillospiraceae bacterium]MDE6955493.1 hypothetical protein [Oscillospiraceae bacterium]